MATNSTQSPCIVNVFVVLIVKDLQSLIGSNGIRTHIDAGAFLSAMEPRLHRPLQCTSEVSGGCWIRTNDL